MAPGFPQKSSRRALEIKASKNHSNNRGIYVTVGDEQEKERKKDPDPFMLNREKEMIAFLLIGFENLLGLHYLL